MLYECVAWCLRNPRSDADLQFFLQRFVAIFLTAHAEAILGSVQELVLRDFEQWCLQNGVVNKVFPNRSILRFDCLSQALAIRADPVLGLELYANRSLKKGTSASVHVHLIH